MSLKAKAIQALGIIVLLGGVIVNLHNGAGSTFVDLGALLIVCSLTKYAGGIGVGASVKRAFTRSPKTYAIVLGLMAAIVFLPLPGWLAFVCAIGGIGVLGFYREGSATPSNG